jgi:hypothetical protein
MSARADIRFDFDKSMRQIRKYQEKYRIIAIIPKDYERIGLLNKGQKIDIYLWSATRLWECLRCGHRFEFTSPNVPKCQD